MFTSGSTGRPKGVVVTHKPLLRRISWMRRTFPISEGDVVPCKTQYVFGVSEWELFHTLTSGATLDLRCDNVVLRQPAALSKLLGDAAALTGHASTVRLHFLHTIVTLSNPSLCQPTIPCGSAVRPPLPGALPPQHAAASAACSWRPVEPPPRRLLRRATATLDGQPVLRRSGKPPGVHAAAQRVWPHGGLDDAASLRAGLYGGPHR